MIYTVRFVNNSTNDGSVCLFQQDPKLAPNVMSLAWFTKKTHPNTNVKFQWSIDYSFVWSQTGALTPGAIFDASEVLSADLETANQISFDYVDGAFEFVQPLQRGVPGSLIINQGGNIPASVAAVGIGMSGAGTFVRAAQPNLNLIYTPNPQYWIAFGSYTTGEVLNVTTMTNSKQIVFPPNFYSMTAILNQDNSWTIQPTTSFDALVFKNN